MVIISLIILAIINFFMFGFNSIDSKILNKNWYHYDYTTGYYELLIINKDKIEYKSNNSQIDLSDCNTYNYDKKKNLIEMNCGKNLEIRKIKSNSLETKIDIYDKVFFDNIEDSMNYEFKNYFGKSIIDFKDEKKEVTEYSKIDSEKLLKLMKEKGYSKIVFMGNNCTSLDCILALDIMEKWIIKNPNIYFFDSNELNNSTINDLSKYISDIDKDIYLYNDISPRVLIIKNGKIIDKYNIKCNGFNCKGLYKNEF